MNCPIRMNWTKVYFCPNVRCRPRASMDVPVTPAPMVQKYCKKVNSLSFKDLGVYSTNPLKLTKKSQLREGKILEDVEQIDTNVFQVDIIDEDGLVNSFTIVVPLEED